MIHHGQVASTRLAFSKGENAKGDFSYSRTDGISSCPKSKVNSRIYINHIRVNIPLAELSTEHLARESARILDDSSATREINGDI